jgi:SAM-dependent methyltransferase
LSERLLILRFVAARNCAEETGLETANPTPRADPPGLILHAALGYDLLVWLATLGGERNLRQRLVSLARLQPGETVLDVGCGTGTLAIAAKRQVGPAGTVHGVDASPEMIARANKKARRAGGEVAFRLGAAQALPFPDARFHVVLSTIMLHHLPAPSRAACAREMRRVLRPGGRVLVVDFAAADRKGRRLLDYIHQRHGRVDFREVIAMLDEAGLAIVESGMVGFRTMRYALGTIANPA